MEPGPREQATLAGVARIIGGYKAALREAKERCFDDIGRLSAVLQETEDWFFRDVDVYLSDLPLDQIVFVHEHLQTLLWKAGVAPQPPEQRN